MVLIAHMVANFGWKEKIWDQNMRYIMVNTMLKWITADWVAMKMLFVVHLLVKDM